MISDDSVQTEGVQSMLKVCIEELLGKEEGVYLMHNVLCILYKKAAGMENAKTAVLLLLEQFTKEEFFGKQVVEEFITEWLQPLFSKDTSFKTRKYLLPCLLAISKHLTKDQVLKEVFSIFKKCCQPSEIWGLRKLCLQLAPELIAVVNDTEAFKFILDFLKSSIVFNTGSVSEEDD